jgi:hypothetical protein
MSGNMLISWLDDAQLLSLANQGPPSPQCMATRYDPTCPSEFYRGYASLLSQVNAALRTVSGPLALRLLIDNLDAAIKALPAGELQNGASFALMNVASYEQSGTLPQVTATVATELVCIAHCFFQNQARGL